jgi:muramoyltetrapeptide carboxypeptidase
MDRAQFIAKAATLAGGWLVVGGRPAKSPEWNNGVIIPPYLKRGDRVGITSPAGFIREEEILPAVERLLDWGFEVRVGDSIGRREANFGGTDEERAGDLQAMLDDPDIKAILCARGGYGVGRILDRLDYTRFRKQPKWVIGFSDITALHLDLIAQCGVASLHSKMCNSFPDDWTVTDPLAQSTILSVRDALTGSVMNYDAPHHPLNRTGKASGLLIGGNLSVIQHCMGTASEPDTKGRILFLEDVGEYRYSIDRMLTNLQRAGKFRHLSGLIVGGFTRLKTESPGDEFGREVVDMILEKVEGTTYPVCFDFPVGHQRNNFALKCGVRHTLNVHPQQVRLQEINMK